MNSAASTISHRERQLGAIINAYNDVTDKLKRSHERLGDEVRRLRDQLEHKDRELARRERLAALGEMAAGVAHEIRNPLGGIELYASLLIKDLKDQQGPRELARRISAAVRSLDGIVGDVLAFGGQPTDGRTIPSVQPVCLGDVVRDVLELVSPSATAGDAVINVGQGLDDVLVQVDPRQLHRALVNLLYNAIEAAGSRGNVWIDASRTSNEKIQGRETCKIEIADDGPGVPPNLLNKVFDPFFTTRDSGTGLGLAVVHGFAESHGGWVRAGNRTQGGAIFTLTLPSGGDDDH